MNGPTVKMRALRGIAALAAVTLLLSGCAAGGAVSGSDGASGAGDLAEVADGMAAYAEEIQEFAQVPAVAIGVITADGLVEARFIGENAAGDAVDAGTLFEIGSSSKAFLGVTEAMLVDRGELAWEDRVVDHYPDFALHDAWVTQEFRVEDLLAQRSGLPEYVSELPQAFGHSWADNLQGMRYIEPERSFRSDFSYQNMTHFVAGEIVAGKIGVDSWNDAVGELVFEPLGMSSSGTGPEALASSENSTRGHTLENGKAVERDLEAFPSIAQGAGSIVSNLDDMGQWVAMHLADGQGPTGELVSAEQLQRTYRPFVAVTGGSLIERVRMGTAPAQVSYATGWFVHSLPEGRVIEHGGNTAGYNAAVMFDPDREVGLVVLANQGFYGGPATHIGKVGMDLLQGREPLPYYEMWREAQEETPAEPADGHPIDTYEGTYVHEMLGTLEMRAEGDTLRTSVGPEGWAATAERESGHVFAMTWNPDDDPDAAERSAVIEFDGAGERPERLTIEGFVFARTG